MWATLLGLLPGVFTSLNSIAGAIANERIAALNAKTDQDRIKAEENIGALQAQQAVLIADGQRSNLDIWIRSLIAFGPMVFLNKIFIYDKVLGWGSTELKNTDYLWNVIMVVLGFYFLHSMSTGLARILKA